VCGAPAGRFALSRRRDQRTVAHLRNTLGDTSLSFFCGITFVIPLVVALVVAKGRPDNGQRDQLRRARVSLANIEWKGVGGVCVCFAGYQ